MNENKGNKKSEKYAKKKAGLSADLAPVSPAPSYWFGGFAFLSFLAYALTLWPSIGGGDSAELVGAACSGGTAHPPGYPLWTMLARAFTYIPFGTIAWRVNLFSAVTSGLAVLVLLHITFHLTRTKWISFFVGGLFAFSPLIWRYSVLAEVFSLNILFCALLIYCVLMLPKGVRFFYAICLLCGFGAAHHHTLSFIAIPAFLIGLWHVRDLSWKQKLVFPVLLLIAGSLPQLYLVFASLDGTSLISWGNQSTLDGFLHHLLRKDYGTFRLATDGTKDFQLFDGILAFFKHSVRATLLLFPLAFYGFYKSKKDMSKRSYYFLMLAPIGYLVVFHSLANLPLDHELKIFRDITSRFWMMVDLFMVIGIGLGLKKVVDRFPNFKWWVPVASVIVIVQAGWSFSTENRRDDWAFSNYGKSILKNLPQNAVLFSYSDINTNTTRYIQSCEGFRKDVRLTDRALLTYPWYVEMVRRNIPDLKIPGKRFRAKDLTGFETLQLFDANFGEHQLYMTEFGPKEDKTYEAKYKIVPYGQTYKLYKKDEDVPLSTYLSESEKFLVDPRGEFKKPPADDQWDFVVYNNYWLALQQRASYLLRVAMTRGNDINYLRASIELLEKLVKDHPEPSGEYYKHLGVALYQLKQFHKDSSKDAIMFDAFTKYLASNPKNKDDTYKQVSKLMDWKSRQPAKN